MKNLKRYVGLTVLFLFLLLNWFGAITVYSFFDENRLVFRTPIMVQSPVLVESKILSPIPKNTKVIITPAPMTQTTLWPHPSKTPTPKIKEAGSEGKLKGSADFLQKYNVILSKEYSEAVLRIWQHESQKGRTLVENSWSLYCQRRGKFNEFGLRAKNGSIACYDTFEESVDDVILSLKHLGYDKNQAKALCVYGGESQQYYLEIGNSCNYYKNHLAMSLE